MNFRLELNIKPFATQLNIRQNIMLVGSCFTDHMSNRLAQHKFKVLENPNGIIFNPLSIQRSVQSYINNKLYTQKDIFYFNELWTSWDHHSKFSHPDAAVCLQQINSSVHQAHHFLQHCDWLILTLGSSFLYELVNDSLGGHIGMLAANCHKVPAQQFVHRLGKYTEIAAGLHELVSSVHTYNKNCNIIFTISPVRHYREGLVENNRSKALLHTVVDEMINTYKNVYYFPAYELVIDDLRDYRFYAEDLVHPNYQATQYVWEKFAAACIDEESRGIMKHLSAIHISKNHKPFHAGSVQHKQFLSNMFLKTEQLAKQYPFLGLAEELRYFSAGV